MEASDLTNIDNYYESYALTSIQQANTVVDLKYMKNLIPRKVSVYKSKRALLCKHANLIQFDPVNTSFNNQNWYLMGSLLLRIS